MSKGYIQLSSRPFLERMDEIRTWALEGITPYEMARRLDMSYKSLQRAMEQVPQLEALVELGKERVDYSVESSLFEQAVGYYRQNTETIIHPDGTQTIKETTKFYPPNIAATQFWLKNRKPERWSEKGGTVEKEEKPPLIIQLSNKQITSDEHDNSSVSDTD